MGTRKLAQLHTVDIDSIPLVDCNGDKGKFDKSIDWDEKTKDMLSDYPEELPDPEDNKILQEYGFKKGEITNLLSDTKAKLESMNFPVCLCHGDFHMRNIVWDAECGNATFVDYEGTRMSPVYTDLNSVLGNRKILELVGFVSPDEPEMTEECRMLWLRSYMEAKYELAGNDPWSIPDAVIERLDVGHRLMNILVSPGMCVFLAVFSAKKSMPVPWIKMLPSARETWEEQKGEIPALMKRYEEL